MNKVIAFVLLVWASAATAQYTSRTDVLCEMKGQHAENKAKSRGKSAKEQETAYENAVFECQYAAMCREFVALGGDVKKCAPEKKR